MELIRGLINLQQQSTACVATIGNFDGVHLGHQAIVARVIEKAKSLGLPSCVLVFEPHPKEFFMSAKAPARLTCFSEKYAQLKALGVDKLLVLQFNQSLREMNAVEFVNNVLIEKLRIKHLVVGDDFHFGHQRLGNFELLEKMSFGRYPHEQYTLEPTQSVLIQNERVSSTLVRESLAEANLNKTQTLLNRRYSITGKVGYGQQLGRTINFPTANVAIKRKKLPVSGVYLVKSSWLQDGIKQSAWGAANCGVRPTVDGENYRLEVHILGVSPDLYGIELSVDFYEFIRAEKKFSGIDELKAQIQLDIEKADKLILQYK
jgi:riboflavin kinase / FMN adenylyltransferase